MEYYFEKFYHLKRFLAIFNEDPYPPQLDIFRCFVYNGR